MQEELKPGTVLRHYKEKLYAFIAYARDAETEEELVVYKTLYGEQGTWVRTKANFFETVTVNGVQVPRFRIEPAAACS